MSAFCKYPGCEHQSDHRPYAYKRDMPSSSAVAGAYDDGKSRSFGWAASLIAATTAIHDSPAWSGLGTDGCTHEKDGLCPACRFVRSEFDRQWTAKADRGSHIHHLVQQWAQGEEVDVDQACEPYMDAAEQFFVDTAPEWVEMERTVLYNEPRSHSYRGQFDWIATINCPVCDPGSRCKWLGDWKTGSYYPASQTLQLASYRHAQHMTVWDDKKEIVDKPVPAVAHAGVVLLGDDGRYQLVELPANGDAFSTFLRMRDVWGWHKQMKTWEREHPLPVKTDDDIEQGVAA